VGLIFNYLTRYHEKHAYKSGVTLLGKVLANPVQFGAFWCPAPVTSVLLSISADHITDR